MTDGSHLSGAVVLLLIVAGSAGYVFAAYVLWRVGQKFGIGSFADYCIPVYNCFLLCRCASISPWHLLWLLVPVADLVFVGCLMGTIARKLKHGFWPFFLGGVLFGLSAIVLAFDASRPVQEEQPVTVQKPSIYCISGEFVGSRLPVGTAGLVIGRNPDTSNVILSSPEISASHTRVWSDLEGRLWIQDMSSSNGTYFSEPGPDGPAEWTEVLQPMILANGVHFRLGDNAIEFVVC